MCPPSEVCNLNTRGLWLLGFCDNTIYVPATEAGANASNKTREIGPSSSPLQENLQVCLTAF